MIPSRRLLLPLLAAALFEGCAARVAGPGADGWIREELWLGAEIPGGGEVGDDAWEAFVAEEIAPRFPAGFSVVAAAGHWRRPDGTAVRERTRVLVILRPAGDEAAARGLEAIADAYVRRFRQDAALHTSGAVQVHFDEPER